jgi:hypothetical protein
MVQCENIMIDSDQWFGDMLIVCLPI